MKCVDEFQKMNRSLSCFLLCSHPNSRSRSLRKSKRISGCLSEMKLSLHNPHLPGVCSIWWHSNAIFNVMHLTPWNDSYLQGVEFLICLSQDWLLTVFEANALSGWNMRICLCSISFKRLGSRSITTWASLFMFIYA